MFITLSENQFQSELARIRTLSPLVHCMTNFVVEEISANVLLAVGASPAMIIAKEEAPDFSRIASALMINIGTLDSFSVEAVMLTARAAGYARTPWVLDPVAAGILIWRDMQLKRLLAYHPTVIRANASEILALAGLSNGGKGVDSTASSDAALGAAQELAQASGAIIALTGATDYVTDGTKTYAINGGNPLATRVVGTGCSLSALVAAFIAKSDNPLLSVACACQMAKRAAEMAFAINQTPGSFKVAYIDSLYTLAQSAHA